MPICTCSLLPKEIYEDRKIDPHKNYIKGHKKLLRGGTIALIAFWGGEYPTKIHLSALGSNFCPGIVVVNI